MNLAATPDNFTILAVARRESGDAGKPLPGCSSSDSQEANGDPFDQLPDELVEHVALQLDGRSLGMFCQVCRRFAGTCSGVRVVRAIVRSKGYRGNIGRLGTQALKRVYRRLARKVPSGTVYAFGANHYGELGSVDKCGRASPPAFEARQGGVPVPVPVPGMRGIIQVAAGTWYSLCLSAEGEVYAFGYNGFGELGLGDQINRDTPTLIPGLERIIEISAGAVHSLCLTADGDVYTFKADDSASFANLECCSHLHRRIPALIPGLEHIVQVASGHYHSLCLTAEGTVYSFGANSFGELGLGDDKIRDVPTLIPTLRGITQVATGNFHSLCLAGGSGDQSQSRVYAFGYNQRGQLGLGSSSPQPRPEEPGGGAQAILLQNVPVLIPGLTGIVQVSAGYEHSLSLSADGHVYAFGSDIRGQLGLGAAEDLSWSGGAPMRCIPTRIPGLDDIIQVAAGEAYSLCLTREGKVYAFGHNSVGELGLGDKDGRKVPTLLPGLDNVVQIAAGNAHSLVICSDPVLDESAGRFSR